QDHPLRKIEQLVDFNFIRSKVANRYGRRGNESVDPAVILKLMFLLFYENIKSERALMSQLQLRLDWLWLCGYDLDEKTPDHSVISKARRRWGLEVFTEFFENILGQCRQYFGKNPRFVPLLEISMAGAFWLFGLTGIFKDGVDEPKKPSLAVLS
ncbi:MAG: transposase, partial [Sedimentisphaerales bacterium]|nr:transposase [Sedimentisphaerales bacterium]